MQLLISIEELFTAPPIRWMFTNQRPDLNQSLLTQCCKQLHLATASSRTSHFNHRTLPIYLHMSTNWLVNALSLKIAIGFRITMSWFAVPQRLPELFILMDSQLLFLLMNFVKVSKCSRGI